MSKAVSSPVTRVLARSLGSVVSARTRTFTFLATTGRSGSHSLVRIFGAVERGVAEHEPYPILNGQAQIDYNASVDAPEPAGFWNSKLPRIYWKAAGRDHYLEASHVFIKCYAESALRAFGERLRVLHLLRHPERVAASYFQRGTIPGELRSDKDYHSGKEWLLDPYAPRNLVRITDELQRLPGCHPFLKTLWYWYETEARFADFVNRHPEVRHTWMTTEDMNDAARVEQVMGELGVPFSPRVSQAVGARTNRSKSPPRVPADLRPSDLEAFHALCLERAPDAVRDRIRESLARVQSD